MENNEEKSAVEKTEENVQMAKDAAEAAGKASTGDWVGAAKNALNLLKNGQFKKRLKMQIIKIIIMIMLPILLGAFVLGVFNVVKDTLVGLIANAISIVAGFFEDAWQYINDDYWFNMDSKREYEIDGQLVSLSVVDKYLQELTSQGVSLEELRLLGDTNYSNVNIFEDENKKALAEKYIAEFIRADFITQQAHRRRGLETVNSSNQNLIDGGIYVYRTKKEPVLDESDFKNEEYIIETVDVTDKEYELMTYITPQEFMQKLGLAAELKNVVAGGQQTIVSKGVVDDLRYKYTIDDETGKMVFIEIETSKTAAGDAVEDGWFDGIEIWWESAITSDPTYKVKLIGVEYKNLISKYAMPYEFLINLCQITQNPEFVYHVALMARDTKIELVVQDNVVMERYTEERETAKDRYESETKNMSDATLVKQTSTRSRRANLKMTQTPVLNIEYANTWSFYEEFEYTKNFEGKIEYTNLDISPKTIPSELRYMDDKGKYYDELVNEIKAEGQRIMSITTYNKSVLKNGSKEKSSQFLGLLRNSTGKCPCSDCYEQGVNLTKKVPNALQCINASQFVKNGKSVEYRIPGMTKTEAPLTNLGSGINMLYEILQNGADDGNTDKLTNPVQNDYNSIYVGRMQGLVEHLQYLMTFPSGDTIVLPEDVDDGEYIGDEYDLAWPLPSDARVSSKFGYRIHPTTGEYTMHNGVDLAVPEGTELYAIADGTIGKIVTDRKANSGLAIYVNHTNGMTSIYMHLSEIKVSVGQEVSKGQLIGLSGNTGRSTGAHLHFGLKLNGGYVNPLQYIKYGT